MSRSYLELAKDEKDHAMALHKESIVIDASTVGFIEHVGEDMMLDDLLKGGITASNATVCMQHNLSEAMGELSHYHDWADKKQDKVLIVKTSEDILKAKKEGKTGIILGPQDSQFLEGKIRFLDIAHMMGVRIIQLSYSWRNFAADGCWEPRDGGLSKYGFELVDAMNKKGLLIDLSHVGDNSTMDAIESSKTPVSFTHVCPRKITPTSHSKYAEWAGGDRFIKLALGRGRTDEALQACAEKGGIVGVTPFFAKKAGPSTYTDDLMDHIDYCVDLVGVNSVAYGSDLDYRNSVTRAAYIHRYPERIDVSYHTAMPKEWGYGWLEHTPNLTRGLVARGYSDAEAKKILGENWVKLFKRIWGK
ncbi:membrane dipeptidase [Candidatus Bathyarchaeota archaeon]|nr:membrane dipeptidase [Candidatus Bathyarchaeota archaeon]